jgi:tetratricopeptide (TPR) repeat protein
VRGPGTTLVLALGLLALALGGCATAYGRGEAALRAGRPDEALRYLEDAYAAAPERLEVRLALGLARFRTRAWDAAVEVLAPVVAEAPGRADARLFLGLAQLMRGDVAAARAELAAVRARDVHPRLAAQLDRVLPLLAPDLDARVRDLIVADLDDAYEWTREVERARRTARAPLEPAWSLVWDHGPGGLYLMHRPPVPATP